MSLFDGAETSGGRPHEQGFDDIEELNGIFEEVKISAEWLQKAEAAMEKAIETGDVTGLKKVINDLRDLGFGRDDGVDIIK